MEVMLQTVIIVFMLFLCSLCLFAVLVIARDMVAESMGKRKSAYSAEPSRPQEQIVKEVTVVKEVPVEVSREAPAPVPVAAPAPAPVVAPAPAPVAVEEEAPAPETVAEEAPAGEAVAYQPEEDDGNAVKFSTTQHTMDTKYAMLSKEHKGFFDAIAKHALSKEGAKAYLTKSYHDYKVGVSRLVRMSIKRGEIVCEFVVIDRDFKDYASRADLKIKASATVIRVTEPSAVGVAKDGIDLVFSQIQEEREYKKQLAREKRRARRQGQTEKEAKEDDGAKV